MEDEDRGDRGLRLTVVDFSSPGYYQHGAIGPFVVREPMVLGHEGSRVVEEVGAEVKNLRVGDHVCMEPGISDPDSRATRLGMVTTIAALSAEWSQVIITDVKQSKLKIASAFGSVRPVDVGKKDPVRVGYIGIPAGGSVPIDIVAAQAKEARIDTIFRYAYAYPKALRLMVSGKINVKPMITDTYPSDKGIEAFD